MHKNYRSSFKFLILFFIANLFYIPSYALDLNYYSCPPPNKNCMATTNSIPSDKILSNGKSSEFTFARLPLNPEETKFTEQAALATAALFIFSSFDEKAVQLAEKTPESVVKLSTAFSETAPLIALGALASKDIYIAITSDDGSYKYLKTSFEVVSKLLIFNHLLKLSTNIPTPKQGHGSLGIDGSRETTFEANKLTFTSSHGNQAAFALGAFTSLLNPMNRPIGDALAFTILSGVSLARMHDGEHFLKDMIPNFITYLFVKNSFLNPDENSGNTKITVTPILIRGQQGLKMSAEFKFDQNGQSLCLNQQGQFVGESKCLIKHFQKMK